MDSCDPLHCSLVHTRAVSCGVLLIWRSFRAGGLDIHGGPVPVGPNRDGRGERLLGGNLSRLNKNTDCVLFPFSPMIGMNWKLRICHYLQRW